MFFYLISSLYQEYDQNGDGIISMKEFGRALEAQKTYTKWVGIGMCVCHQNRNLY